MNKFEVAGGVFEPQLTEIVLPPEQTGKKIGGNKKELEENSMTITTTVIDPRVLKMIMKAKANGITEIPARVQDKDEGR